MKAISSGLLLALLAMTAFADSSTNEPTTVVDQTTAPQNVSNGTTTTTTAAPTTTTIAPTTTTTVRPPAPLVKTYTVKEDGKTCIVLKMGATFNFTYMNTDNKTVWIEHNLPNETVATGACGKNGSDSENIDLTFFNNWKLAIVFEKSGTKYSSKQATLKYETIEARFPGIKDVNQTKTATAVNQTLFEAAVGNSYYCKSEESVKLGDGVSFETTDLQVQAFRTTGDESFGTAEDCANDNINNIVPIAVGAALAGLVLIVLIAYLIGRKRSRSGYESV